MNVRNHLAYTTARSLCTAHRRWTPIDALFFAALLVGVVGWGPVEGKDQAELQKFEYTEPHMGTEFTLVFYATDGEIANKAQQAAFQRIADLNDRLSDYRAESELSRLSAGSPHSEAIPVSPDLCRVLQRAQWWSEQTEGAFDVTVGPATRLWRRARKLHEFPAAERLAAAQAAIGYQAVELDAAACRVRLTKPNMKIDLGGIAVGMAVDDALAILADHGVTRALINAGGDIGANEPPPGTEGWPIALSALEPRQPPRAVLLIRHAAVTTSGDAWQFVEFDGRRYGHIVDPSTGLGLTTRSSVSAVAPRCIDADVLATALCVLGPDRAKAWIEQRRDQPYWMSGIYVDAHDQRQRIEAGVLPDTVRLKTD